MYNRPTDPCRAFLDSYREAKFEVRRLGEKLQQLTARVTKMTATLSDEPKGGGADRNQLLAAFADATASVQKKYCAAIKRQQDVENFIDSVGGDLNRIILRLRYVELMRWPDIQKKMEEANLYYTDRHLFRLHGEALNAARREWERRTSC